MGAAKSASVLRQLSGSSRAMNKRLAIFQHNPVRRGDTRDFTAPARVSLAAFPIGSVGAGAKLDRDGSKLDTGDGAKLDFWGIAP
jgi:hypothetical protein